MNQFHRHPDGFVFVRTAAGVYVDTPGNFQLDYGQPLPTMPIGADEQLYEPNVKNAYMGGGTIIEGGPRQWVYGDAVIAAYPQLIAAQAARQPPPTSPNP
jgi:hypothetical protein